MGEGSGRVAVEGPAELEDRRGAVTDVVAGVGEDVDREVVGAEGGEDAGRADEAGAVGDGAVEDGAEGDVGEDGDDGDAGEGEAASALTGAVAAG